MYWPFGKYLTLAGAIGALVSAGVALANHGYGQGFAVCGLLGAAFLMAYSYECKNQGAQPLTRLKPGEYRVEAIFDDDRKRAGFTRLVVSWHADYGHYEYRVANLSTKDIICTVNVGDLIRVTRLEDGLLYTVVRPGITVPQPGGLYGLA